jgi:hexosaminidase
MIYLHPIQQTSSRRFFQWSAVVAWVLLAPAGLLCATTPRSASPNLKQTQTNSAPDSKLALIPMPREIHPGALLHLNGKISVLTTGRSSDDRFAVEDLAAAMRDRGIHVVASSKQGGRIVLVRDSSAMAHDILRRFHLKFNPAMHDEGYVLVTEGTTTYDIAATGAGLYYGAQTVKQLVAGRGAEATLQGIVVRDWPAMKYRGLDDDLSRGPVPTLAFQEHQLRLLSQYKINIYSPYFENTLAYASNPLMAPPGGAMTRADVEELVQYARRYHITIVPEQEAFGHLHHVLMYDTYSNLAETPHGSVLAPEQPGSISLIKQWFGEIAVMFPGPFVHIGADETFDLGRGQSKALVEKEGLGTVYIDFVKQIHASLAPLHKRLLFWGDVAMNDPGLVKTLPKDMIAVAWWYRPEAGGYDKWLMPYVNAGMETWVAPSVNDMRLVYPNNNDALLNIQRFVSDGQRLGSTGELNTVWDANNGEGLFLQDWYGALFGAAAAWQPGTSNISQFQNSYGQVFHGDLSGKINQAQIELMAAHKLLQKAGFTGASEVLFWEDPWSKAGQEDSAKVLPVAREMRLHAERAIILIAEARAAATLRHPDALDAMDLGARRMDFLGYKFEAADEIAQEYARAYREENDPAARQDLNANLDTIYDIDGQCQDLRDGYGLIRDLYRKTWLRENRPYYVDTILTHYDLAMERWIQRGDRFGAATRQCHRTRSLPTPAEMGLPPQ